MVKVCVVGAGLSGLTVAHELIEKGFEVVVYEKHHTAGGMARSEREKHNVPGEHSWRGYGPFYYNVFDIMKRIPIIENFGNNITFYKGEKYDLTPYINKHPGGSIIKNAIGKNVEEVWEKYGVKWHLKNNHVMKHLKELKVKENFKTSVYNNLTDLKFLLLRNKINLEDKINKVNIFDLPYIAYLTIKNASANKRKEQYHQELIIPRLKKYMSKNGYKYFVNFLAGAGYGFDLNSMSYSHFFSFFEKNMYEKFKLWKVTTKPTNEAWINPWLKLLKQKGVSFHYNHELKQIVHLNNNIKNLLVNNKKIIADEYCICINPYNMMKVLELSNLPKLYEQHQNLSIINNQISFRIGFSKKLNLLKKGYILVDTPYYISFYPQDEYFEDVDLGMDGKIKTLISGTITQTYKPGSLYNQSATSLSRKKLMKEVVHQIFESNEFMLLIPETTKKDIIYAEVFNEWQYKNGRLESDNKKWVNTNYNEKYRPNQKTNIKNMYIGGGHTKTTTNVWTMESSVESGKLVSNLVLEKHNKEKAHIHHHQSSIIFRIIHPFDDLLYKLKLPSIVDIILVIGAIILIKKEISYIKS